MTDIPSIEGRFLSLDYIRLDRFNHNKEENGLVYTQCITFSKEMVTFYRDCYSLLDFFGD